MSITPIFAGSAEPRKTLIAPRYQREQSGGNKVLAFIQHTAADTTQRLYARKRSTRSHGAKTLTHLEAAEALFKRKHTEHEQDALAQYRERQEAQRRKTERLRALRLAKENEIKRGR